LCQFAAQARRLPDLTLEAPMPLVQYIKRRIYYCKLRLGQAR
jgi:hypothetical protein